MGAAGGFVLFIPPPGKLDGSPKPRARVPDVCPKCLMQFRHHVVIRARCTKRWRGANFDLMAAQGNLAAALAARLGMPARTSQDLEALLHKVVVKAYGEGLDPNPAQEFDAAQGESFEFHVGLRFDPAPEQLAALDKTAREAIAASRHFVLAST